MAYTNSLHSSSLGPWDLHNLGVFNADISSTTYNMEINAPCLVLPNGDNYPNFLSTGYLEDALIEFGARFKRRKLMVSSNANVNANEDDFRLDPLSTLVTNDLSYWSNCSTNYNMHSEEELSHASLVANHHHHHHDMHFSEGDTMENSMQEMCEELINFPEKNTLLLEEIVSPSSSIKLQELSCNSRDNSLKTKSSDLVCNSDTYSTDSSSNGDNEIKKKKKNDSTRMSSTSKMVYPFGLVKPGGEDGDITLNDINHRILKPPTRPLKHPVGDFASRPAVSPNGPGLSGKAVVAFTKIHTQGRGTITIIRTKG
ncbi:uncharacterized protein LOC141643691 [Silene latifolia]|uniref:uncharacterized protein LOC141643691 n=1 Tax=Silene latifolia TaxID=37657 RepID=UPI003D784C9F